MRRDLGDFQTPSGLVSAVLDRLDDLEVPRSRVLEPTCGRGHFLRGLLDRAPAPREVVGFEIQPEHLDQARGIKAPETTIALTQADIFAVDLGTLRWSSGGPLLVVGNPPWVTTAELGRIGGSNRPARGRVEGLVGLDARTGRSNFDIAEAVWGKLLTELDEPGATIALLGKASTARGVFRRAVDRGVPIASASFHRIDARRWFGASVDAGLFVVRLGPTAGRPRMDVYPDFDARRPESSIGLADGMLVADLDAFDRSSEWFGSCGRTWRQGVKHDAAALMELVGIDGRWTNGLGEPVVVEPDFVYPLLKGADLARAPAGRPARSVIVTQRSLGDDTGRLEVEAPRLWSYLRAHAGAFAARRSRIYDARPPFSIFGIGPYAFAPHKVAVSGLHPHPTFRAIGPAAGRPVLLDDTCYLLPCENAAEAASLASALNGPEAQSLIGSLCFRGAKRPITKALLQRIDLDRLTVPTLASLAGVG